MKRRLPNTMAGGLWWGATTIATATITIYLVAPSTAALCAGIAGLLLVCLVACRRLGRLTVEMQGYRSEARLRSLVEHVSDVVMVIDSNLHFSYLSPSVFPLLGYRPDELINVSLTRLLHVGDVAQAAFLGNLNQPMAHQQAVELRLRHAEGHWMTLEVTITDLRHLADVDGIVLSGRDVTEHKALEVELRHKALHDALTGLANRTLFTDRVIHSLGRRVDVGAVAVIFIDLDSFKTVNDGLGHLLGDRVLAEIARRLRGCVRSGDTAARLGGDEFAILLEDVSVPHEIEVLAQRILLALGDPLKIEGHDLEVGASIGIAVNGPGVATAEELLRNADMAMYVAKEHGKGRWQLFEPEMRSGAFERLALKADIPSALIRREFFVQYQPVVQLATGRLVGAEALARWRHPERGFIAPDLFVPVAEQTGAITRLGEFILDQACGTLVGWQKDHPDQPFRVSVNLSIRQLDHPELARRVAEALDRHHLNPADVLFEISQGSLALDVDLAAARLRQLKKLGVRLAVDDFVAATPSLSSLAPFPLDELKIDRSLVAGLGDPDTRHLVGGIIAEAASRGLSTVAEGVETAAQVRDLFELRCEDAQGFYFLPPVAPAELSGVIDSSLANGRLHSATMAGGTA